MEHLSLRLAWHNDGWNGCVCKDPKKNTYCIGNQSFPGTLIAEQRDLERECQIAGTSCAKLQEVIACSNSINAFGLDTIKNRSIPPTFFNKDAEIYYYDMPPATACTWPYEAMYSDEEDKYNYDKKLENAKSFFGKLIPQKSLVFYYANKSNPFSEDDNKNYVLVGIGRLKSVGEIMYYENTDQRVKDTYGGGFIWQMPITSNYPNEGFRIPYHKYLDNPEILNNLLYIPEQSNNFKYAAKHINDDDALIYIERLISIVQYLIDIKDTTEDWNVRKAWLQSLMAELWISRGAYPGLPALLDYLECNELISYYFDASKLNDSQTVAVDILNFLEDRSVETIGSLEKPICDKYHKNWAVKLVTAKHKVLAKLLARISLKKEQIEHILDDARAQNGITSSLSDIIDDIYILCEQYVGDNIGDEITFKKKDHGVIHSPNIGLEPLYDKDDWRRLRALIVGVLKYETIHSFIDQSTVLERVNHKLQFLPDWKKENFNDAHIEYDKVNLENSIVFKQKEKSIYLYLKQVFEDERLIEDNLKELLGRGDVKLYKPFPKERWRNELFETKSNLAKKVLEEYEKAIEGQIDICSQIFNKSCSVIAGSAGTGKTTIIKAIIKAIKSTSNNSESICLLAPTGKAADRIRYKTEEHAITIHTFLTQNKWLNYNNWTLKHAGGLKCDKYTTYIIDESSMIDLNLMAGLFKAIDWDVIKRLIFVGDPNQLPPIGRGKVFAEVIDYLKEVYPENYGRLSINLRQMENRVSNAGTGILDLASMYINGTSENNDFEREDLLKKIQESDEEVFSDLSIIPWNNVGELEEKLSDKILSDSNEANLLQYQIISPYRGEFYGTDYINSFVQQLSNKENLERYRSVAGITAGDKIIQIRNRANSDAYKDKARNKVEVFNGELGLASFCNYKTKTLSVHFEQKKNNVIDIKGDMNVENNIELGYAISVHKSQGSEFSKTYFILPKSKQSLLSSELLYTGITRAQKHLTIFIEGDFRTLFSMMRPERARLKFINSSVFNFNPICNDILNMGSWYEEGKIHATLSEYFVRSKSEVIIANLLFENGFESFKYEEPLFANDGSFYLPDFTINWKGKTFYWEHLGMINSEYERKWNIKEKWYNKHFPDQLITTIEGNDVTLQAKELIQKIKRDEI